MIQRAEAYRITVRYPWIDLIWMKPLGDARAWVEVDSLAVAPELKQFCLRMAYQLQMDSGCLLCVSRQQGRYVLNHAIPVTIVNITKPPILQSGLRFGADPEFVLVRNKHPLNAAKYIPRHNWIGTDYLRLSVDKQIPALVELRPIAQSEVTQLYLEIRKLIKELDDYVVDDSIHFIAGSMPFPGLALGGHLHVSGILPEVDFVRVLDNYLALPLALCEEERDVKARRPRYGQLGDIRFQPHGGFEYRTCPSWLEHPDWTSGVLELFAFLTENYQHFHQRWLSDTRMVKAFYEANETLLFPVVQLIWEDLWQWRNHFSDFMVIERLFHRILSRMKWARSGDFRKNWRV